VAGAELIYYWDTCLFLAWIKDEERKSGEMDGVREIIERSKRRLNLDRYSTKSTGCPSTGMM
jgi:hypothetical protein